MVGDTLNPLEGDKLLSIGGTLAMFPQEPHKVGGCTHNLTQTTQVQTRYPLPVARVLGYYYRMFLAISYGSLSRVLPIWEHLVDTLVLQVSCLVSCANTGGAC